MHAIDKIIPKKYISTNQKRVPWWTNEIADLIKQQRKLQRKYYRSKNIEIFIEYKKIRSKTRREILKEKSNS